MLIIATTKSRTAPALASLLMRKQAPKIIKKKENVNPRDRKMLDIFTPYI